MPYRILKRGACALECSPVHPKPPKKGMFAGKWEQFSPDEVYPMRCSWKDKHGKISFGGPYHNVLVWSAGPWRPPSFSGTVGEFGEWLNKALDPSQDQEIHSSVGHNDLGHFKKEAFQPACNMILVEARSKGSRRTQLVAYPPEDEPRILGRIAEVGWY